MFTINKFCDFLGSSAQEEERNNDTKPPKRAKRDRENNRSYQNVINETTEINETKSQTCYYFILTKTQP